MTKTKTLFVLVTALCCACSSDDSDTTSTSEDSTSIGSASSEAGTSDTSESPAGAGDLKGELEPKTNTITSTMDQCCPVLSNGRVLDELCSPDEQMGSDNDCVGAPLNLPTGWDPAWISGNATVTSWTLVACAVCGANSPNCSSTRWQAFNAFPLAGWQCMGTAIQTSNGTTAWGKLVEDNCSDDACTGANSGMVFSEAGLGCGGNEYYTTPNLRDSVAAMCCAYNDLDEIFYCLPAGGQGQTTDDNCTQYTNYTSTPNEDGDIWYEWSNSASPYSGDFENLAYCVRNEGCAANDETCGNWDLPAARTGHSLTWEWGQTVADAIADNPQTNGTCEDVSIGLSVAYVCPGDLENALTGVSLSQPGFD